MFKCRVVEGHVSLTLALAVHRNPCARLMTGCMHVLRVTASFCDLGQLMTSVQQSAFHFHFDFNF